MPAHTGTAPFTHCHVGGAGEKGESLRMIAGLGMLDANHHGVMVIGRAHGLTLSAS